MLDQILGDLNLVDLVIIPVVAYLGHAIKNAITAYIDKAKTKAKDDAMRSFIEYAQFVVQSCFVQVIEPAWKAFKQNPGDMKLKERYHSSLAEAKIRAMNQMATHLKKLPDFISEFLAGKLNDIIEGVIPLVKSHNKSLKNPQ